MVWGAIAAAGISYLGARKSAKSAKGQEGLALEELEFQREQARFMNNMRTQAFDRSVKAFDREDEMFDYMMGANQRNEAASRDFLNYSRDFVQQDQQYRADEQQYEKYRISAADKDAAGERARQLQALINDQGLAASERQQALEELDYTRQLANGEREYDIKAYEADQMRSQMEYQYRLNEYEKQTGVATDERQFEIDRQEKILRQANILSDDIDSTMRSFGTLEGPRRYGEEDVNRVAGDFYAGFLSDADRAADRLASVNEAGLIRGGVDNSTGGDSSRRQLLQEQLVPLYDTARNNSRLQALGYIDGVQDNEIEGFNAEVAARAAAIDEQIRGKGALLQVMQQMNSPVSAKMNEFLQLGGGNIGPRNFTNVSGVNGPLQVGSQILGRNISSGVAANTALATSRAGVPMATATGQFNPLQPNFTSGGSLSSVSLGGGGYDSNFATLAAGASDASSNATQGYLGAASNGIAAYNSWNKTPNSVAYNPGVSGASPHPGYADSNSRRY